jgi:hypothetical protein
LDFKRGTSHSVFAAGAVPDGIRYLSEVNLPDPSKRVTARAPQQLSAVTRAVITAEEAPRHPAHGSF